MTNNNSPIGIFDSGVGGLTVAKEIRRVLPNESIIYFGDTMHVPYGDKSKETIVKYTTQITRFLMQQNCKAIVIACNTAAANAYKEILAETNKDIPVFDVITPVTEKVSFELYQKIGIIATKGTVNSGIYKKKIKKLNKYIEIIEIATPLFVPIIEEGFINSDISKATIKHYLSNKKFNNIDALILGCTHYPLISKEISAYFNNKIKVIDSPLIVAKEISHYFDNKKIRADKDNIPTLDFYLSDFNKNFEKQAKNFFGKEISLSELKI